MGWASRANAKPQRELVLKQLDKNGQLRGALPGEKRKNVGRPRKKHGRASERHLPRVRFTSTRPLHVVMRVARSVRNLRTERMMFAIREALITLAKREGAFRIVHMSVQRKHLHLLVEASSNDALSAGMKAFGISAAKHLNAALPLVDGERRRGVVFPDRYHAVQLGTPTQVRNCIAYVLNNWRHHGEDRGVTWRLDPFSSAVTFDGWRDARDGQFVQPPGYIAPLVWAPTTWLLRQGWRKRGLIGSADVPGGVE